MYTITFWAILCTLRIQNAPKVYINTLCAYNVVIILTWVFKQMTSDPYYGQRGNQKMRYLGKLPPPPPHILPCVHCLQDNQVFECI